MNPLDILKQPLTNLNPELFKAPSTSIKSPLPQVTSPTNPAATLLTKPILPTLSPQVKAAIPTPTLPAALPATPTYKSLVPPSSPLHVLSNPLPKNVLNLVPTPPFAGRPQVRPQDWKDVGNLPVAGINDLILAPIGAAVSQALSIYENATGKESGKVDVGIPSPFPHYQQKTDGDYTRPVKLEDDAVDIEGVQRYHGDLIRKGVDPDQAYAMTRDKAWNDALSLLLVGREVGKFGLMKAMPEKLITPELEKTINVSRQAIKDYISGRAQYAGQPELPPEVERALKAADGKTKLEIMKSAGVDIVTAKPSLLGRIFGVSDEEAKSLLTQLKQGVRGKSAGALPGYRETPGQAPAFGMSVRKVEPVGGASLPTFEGFNDISTNVLNKLEGRTSVSKQFITDLTNAPELKQAEKDVIRNVLKEYPEGNIPVKDFADKVHAELLPIENTAEFTRSDNAMYENVTLPDKERGPVADYRENVYGSPIKTSGGDVHGFGTDNYFAHSRVEDLPTPKVEGAKTAGEAFGLKGGTRRVIELQSDLFQKGHLENEGKSIYAGKTNDEIRALLKETNPKQTYSDEAINGLRTRAEETSKLEPYRNTWHERVIKEEVKQAAKDGKTKLQFPTGETAMKIEGLGGEVARFYNPSTKTHLKVDDLKVGLEWANANLNDRWIVTDVLGDGKFTAVPKSQVAEAGGFDRWNKFIDGSFPADYKKGDFVPSSTSIETFDISGKVDTNNPIYKFYEKEVGRYLKNKYGAVRVTDPQGVSWYEVPVKPEMAHQPVTAFNLSDKGARINDNEIRSNTGAATSQEAGDTSGRLSRLPGRSDVSQRSGDVSNTSGNLNERGAGAGADEVRDQGQQSSSAPKGTVREIIKDLGLKAAQFQELAPAERLTLASEMMRSYGLPEEMIGRFEQVMQALPAPVAERFGGLAAVNNARSNASISLVPHGDWVLRISPEHFHEKIYEETRLVDHEVSGHLTYTLTTPETRGQIVSLVEEVINDPALFETLWDNGRQANSAAAQVAYISQSITVVGDQLASLVGAVRTQRAFEDLGIFKNGSTLKPTPEYILKVVNLKKTILDRLEEEGVTIPEKLRTFLSNNNSVMASEIFARAVEYAAKQPFELQSPAAEMVRQLAKGKSQQGYFRDSAEPLERETLMNQKGDRDLKLEKQAHEAHSFSEFYERSGVTRASLDATVQKKGFKNALDFYNKTKRGSFPKDFTMNQKEINDANAELNRVFEQKNAAQKIAILKTHLDELKTEKETIKQALEEHPAKGLVKYISSTTGELPEVTGKSTMSSLTGSGKEVPSSEFARKGDDIVQNDFGFPDLGTADKSLKEYLKIRDAYATVGKEITRFRKELRLREAFDAVIKSDPNLKAEYQSTLKQLRVTQKQIEQSLASKPSPGSNSATSTRNPDLESRESNFPYGKSIPTSLSDVKPPVGRGGITPPELHFLNWKDRPALSLSRDTLERNIEKVAGEDAPLVKKFIIDPTRKNETARVKFVNKMRDDIRTQVVERLGIRAKSKESQLVQQYGEHQFSPDDKENLNQLQHLRPTDWHRIKEAAEIFKQKYDELLDMVNTERENFGYKPIPRHADYFRHFQAIDSAIKQFGLLLREQELPTEIAGITGIFNPNKPFSTAELRRRGELGATEDAVRGMDNYLDSISKQIFHLDSVNRGRQLEKYIRQSAKVAASGVESDQIKLPNFVSNLHDYTNIVAGKKSALDRALESIFGRRLYGASNFLRRRLSANLVLGNISSALTNFIPFSQSLATTTKAEALHGIGDALTSPLKSTPYAEIDGVVSDFLVRRFPEHMIDPRGLDKAAEFAGWLFEAVDRFTAKSVVAGKYYENLSKGMTKAEAMDKANAYAGKILADRSVGQTPNIFSSQSLGFITQFQTEVNNMFSFMVKDIPDMSEKSKGKLFSMLLQFFLYSYLFNEGYKKVTGRRPTLDPIYAAMTLMGITPASEDVAFTKRLYNAGNDLGGNLPFLGAFTGGRFPLLGALPDVVGLLKGTATPKTELLKLATLLPPFGGGQIKKTAEGIYTVAKGQERTPSGKTKRYSVDQTPLNYAQAALFGKSALPSAQAYYDGLDKKYSPAKKGSNLFGISLKPKSNLAPALKSKVDLSGIKLTPRGPGLSNLQSRSKVDLSGIKLTPRQ